MAPLQQPPRNPADPPDPATAIDAPLAGVKVLDLSRILAGPYCAMILGDMGAEVIKVEAVGAGDDMRGWGPPFVNGEGAYFLTINRNKKSLAVDLKSPRGREILHKLVDEADVLVENFRPGTTERLGLGWEELHARNPRLVYCSISGFGQTGPRKYEASFDLICQGEAGLMGVTGFPDGSPTKVGIAISDLVAALWAVQGILMALYQRGENGEGRYVDISLLDSLVSLLTFQAGIHFTTGEDPGRKGNAHATVAPYETYPAADGYFNLAVGNDSLWSRFCRAAGREDLEKDPRFAVNRDRVTNRIALNEILERVFRNKPVAHWLEILKEAGIPCGRINSMSHVFTDPQVIERGMIFTLDHPVAGKVQVPGSPLKLSETPPIPAAAPPLVGQHTREILADLGYSQADVDQLEEAGVVQSCPPK
ncbi:MAG: CoA transferase [Firmicutes bacterium]|nr:CoA transferase [Bacillota bacterium]